jgi:molybdate transport system ATP-binding protein
MNGLKHCAFDIAADSDYDKVIDLIINGTLLKDHIPLPVATGALYSHRTINKIIEEELLHDHFTITTASNASLKSMSSGEQKRALLQYIIHQHPGFIIIDNVLDNLDAIAQQNIVNELSTLAHHTLIIQIISRKKDILPFIETIFTVVNNNIVKQHSVDEYSGQHKTAAENYFSIEIPPALQQYNLPDGPLVQLHDVCVSYDERPVLNKINWTINRGEFWQLAGPNGSGKSTILSLITGDNPKGYGQNIILFGMQKGSGETVWDIKQNIGYLNATMAQFFPRLDSVEKMILSGFFDSIGLYTIPNETQVKTAHAWLRAIHLLKDKDRPFCFLPLDKQRMVLVARAMVKHPPLLILDEPTSGLDDDEVLLFTALINKIAAATTTAILYVSHRPEEGLQPQLVFQLHPSENGAGGQINKW